MVLYFIATVFLSATLLFSVQPMVAKTLLPVFGGSSSVWTTCMLFYQTVLLLGYLYAHFVMKKVSWRAQLWGHIGMLILALAAGFVFDSPSPPPNSEVSPVLWLLLQLGLVSGLPFFMISSAGPLVQGWFARTDHPRAHDPYFLYAASNAGSFVGLLAYPFLVEPWLGLDQQRTAWLSGFAVFIVLSAGAILMTKRGNTQEPHAPPGDVLIPAIDESKAAAHQDDPIDWMRRLRWMFYAFVPSSMLLGVTSHISMDIASFPLLWVLPLSVYLLTMIIAFAVDAEKLVISIRRPLVIAIIAATILILADDAQNYAPIFATVGVQLLLLLLVGLTGHGLLAANRPAAEHLTEFYLIMSIGGALGGFFNGIIAPMIFESTLEYQIGLLCTALLIPWPRIGKVVEQSVRKKMWLIRAGIPLLALTYMLIMGLFAIDLVDWMTVSMGFGKSDVPVILFVIFVLIPAGFVYLCWKDGIACMLVLSIPLLIAHIEDVSNPKVQYRSRTFYGILKVVDDVFYDQKREVYETVRSLMHGTTNHGVQYLDPALQQVPLGYYHIQGPCGMGITTLKAIRPDGADIGIVGLGSGAITAHARTTDTIRYFEIDPEVVRIAQNPEYFTYLSNAACPVEVEVGDGRLLLERERDSNADLYDMVLIDAFSSDSIPVHLLTKEAIGLYFDRIEDDGIVLLHISNRHLEIHSLAYELAKEHKAFMMMYDQPLSEIDPDQRDYWFPSIWVGLTKDQSTAQQLLDAGMFQQTAPDFEVRIWTDQYSNILSLFR